MESQRGVFPTYCNDKTRLLGQISSIKTTDAEEKKQNVTMKW